MPPRKAKLKLAGRAIAMLGRLFRSGILMAVKRVSPDEARFSPVLARTHWRICHGLGLLATVTACLSFAFCGMLKAGWTLRAEYPPGREDCSSRGIQVG